MTVFEQVKSALDMPTVAKSYGLSTNRSGMALCPFHNEKTPSAKIYPDSFHCFGCGEHTDVIGFTQKLFNLDKPIQAIRKLNEDFSLNIDLEKAPDKKQISEYHKHINEQQEYECWEKYAWETLCSYYRLMKKWREYAPKSEDEQLNELFVYSLHHLDYAEYMCDEFLQSDKQGRLDMKESISAIAEIEPVGSITP